MKTTLNPKELEVFKVYWSGGTPTPFKKNFFIADMDELEHAKKKL